MDLDPTWHSRNQSSAIEAVHKHFITGYALLKSTPIWSIVGISAPQMFRCLETLLFVTETKLYILQSMAV